MLTHQTAPASRPATADIVSVDSPGSPGGLTRRGLLGSGAALVLAFHLPHKAIAATQATTQATATAASPLATLAPNAYVRIDQDGRVTLVVAMAEMGQGTLTSIPMLIAEELDLDLTQLSLEQAPADEARYGHPLYGLQVTGGSAAVRGAWAKLRQVGATTRLMLVTAAAQTWGVPAAQCQTRSGMVIHPPSGRRLTYGELVPAAARLPVPAEAPLKAPAEFRLVGTSPRRLDTPAKVDGSAVFGIDINLPGMKVAAIANCPFIGGSTGAVDGTQALKLKGVRRVLVADNAVAVVADHYGAARKGLAALKVDWIAGPAAGFSTAQWRQQLGMALRQEGLKTLDEGNFDAAYPGGASRHEATYEAPALAHATMEPLNCTLHVRKDGCDVWLGSQAPSRVQRLVAAVLGMPAEQVRVHNQLLGGGFGRKLDADYVETAAKLVKQVDYPVKVVFSREEDMQHDAYRPLFLDEMRAALDASGRVLAFEHKVAGSAVVSRYAPVWLRGGHDADAVRVAESAYDIPHRRVRYMRDEPPNGLLTGNWRGVGPTHHVFVTECFIDELAAAAGADPVRYREQMLSSKPRLLAVLRLAAEKARWNSGAARTPGRGRGVAVVEGFGSYAALIADVQVSADGSLRVDRLVCAADCGLMISPDGVESQIQGGLVYGLTAALHGPITIEGGRIQQSNFHDYPMLRMSESPVMEVHLSRNTLPPGGTGELSTPLVAPALLNAIFAATGKRWRTYPVSAEQLKSA